MLGSIQGAHLEKYTNLLRISLCKTLASNPLLRHATSRFRVLGFRVMKTPVMGYIGTTTRIPSFIPS